MAESLVGGAFLSASLHVLFDRLASRELISFFSKRKLDDGLRDKLEITLLALQAVSDDAEGKQITNKYVKAWLDELQHVVYQADDLLDEIATKTLRDKLEADHHQSQSQSSATQAGFTRFFSPFKQSLFSINQSVYLSDAEIESRMKEIASKLELFVVQKQSLNLRDDVGRKPSQSLPPASLVDEFAVYGRDNDKEKIIELLLSDNATGNHEIGVIPIVGKGGMGKTTLAQFVYDDARVNHNFPVKSWVCVSDTFDISMITKKILDDVTSSSNNGINSLDQLQTKLKDSLSGKKFLIVLDDVWNDNYIDWDLLRRPFKTGAQESRIIVTTRIDTVASMMGTISGHLLERLPLQDCWSLFVKHAFVNGNYMAYPELFPIGRKIVVKCAGVPLAAKLLGGLLRSKWEIDEWENVLCSTMWDLDSTLPALRLTYHYLPSQLKRCFAYCSMFPKDYIFEKKKLVQLWIALDLVQQQSKSNKSVEDEGNDCFQELLSRIFFQRSNHTGSYFVMHDLIHDLAQDIYGAFCFRLDYDKPIVPISEKVRHFSYIRSEYDAFEKFKVVNEVKCLRTFMSFSRDQLHSCYLGNKVLHDMLPILRFLRVLSLSKYQISELPKSIENLIHLRYLDLSKTRIKQLHDSVTTLCNLRILDLSYCEYLIGLPVNMGNLINLRHLDIKGTRLTEMPMQMSRLKDLRHLTYFVVSENIGSRIIGLKELFHLRGKLEISGLENVVGGLDASEANMKNKKHLEGLELIWDGDTNDSTKERDVLDKLEPHKGMKTLSIFNYGSTKFPDWLQGAHSFHNMVSVELINCANCYSLPSIGQIPSLKDLRIEGMKAIRNVGREFYGDTSSSIKPFQSLETLSFKEMEEWEGWHALGAGEFFCLVELCLVDCPKLTGELPNHFPSLRKLEISKCQQLLSNQIGLLLQGMPSLLELKMSEMINLTELPQQLQQLSSLQELTVSDIPNLKKLLPELCKLIKLERLEMEKCRSLLSFLDAGLPPMLKTLKIRECEALQTITVALAEGINCICLEELRLSQCSSLLQVSFPTGGLPPPTLKVLVIEECRSLEFPLPEETEHNYQTYIEVLEIIRSCHLLKSLSLGFFQKLRSLEIRGCINFETLSIPDEEFQNLMVLRIEDCPRMVSFAQRGLPAPNLTSFTVWSCENLKSLPPQMHTLLPSLQALSIGYCPQVVSIPDEEFQNLMVLRIEDCPRMVSFAQRGLLAPNLTSFTVWSCENLKSLPPRMHTLLPSLQTLSIGYCPQVESFPYGGLPSKLRSLSISNCEKLMKGRRGWDLQETLPFLEYFEISGGYEEVLKSFPEEWLLPTSLTSLDIFHLPNLKSLNHKGLQHLTSLTDLYIDSCPKLWSLPKEGLPNSLSYLEIWNCPLLKPRCQREKGEDWPNISRIRHIQLDDEEIVNLE